MFVEHVKGILAGMVVKKSANLIKRNKCSYLMEWTFRGDYCSAHNKNLGRGLSAASDIKNWRKFGALVFLYLALWIWRSGPSSKIHRGKIGNLIFRHKLQNLGKGHR